MSDVSNNALPYPLRNPVESGGLSMLVSFEQNGDSVSHRVSGWSFQEKTHIWTIGQTSILRFPSYADKEPLVLELDVAPYVSPPLLLGQILRISVNGHLLGSDYLTERTMLRIKIPADLVVPGNDINITFEHPGYLSPLVLRRHGDARPLAICFFTVRLSSTRAFEANGPLAWSGSKPQLRELAPLSQSIKDAMFPVENVTHRFSSERTFYGPYRPSPAIAFLREGWAIGQDGPNVTWTNARVSEIELPGTELAGPYLLLLHVIGLVGGDLPGQEFTVFLDGAVLGSFVARDETVLSIPMPAERVQGRPTLSLTFDLPSACRPRDIGHGADSRSLALSFLHIEIETPPPRLSWLGFVREDDQGMVVPVASSRKFLDDPPESLVTTLQSQFNMSLIELLGKFESLGINCEFGFVARKLGFEALHLLRFGSIRAGGLVRGLAEDFAAFDQPSEVAIRLSNDEPPEYIFEIERYQGRWHTFTYTDKLDKETVLAQQTVKYSYLRRKFFEGLRSSRKIYVFKRDSPLSVAEASALLIELNRHGRNILLYVTLCTNGRPSGMVELVGPGLMRGYITAFAPNDDVGEATDPTIWLRLLANAWLLDQDYGASFRTVPE